MKTELLLERLGLPGIEGKIYLALLELGSGSISAIAKRARLYRHDVYRHLSALQSKHLISISPRGKRIEYVAESPKVLAQQMEHLQEAFVSMLPKLVELYSESGTKPAIRFMEGDEGIKAFYRDLVDKLKKGDTYYRYESPKNNESTKKYVPLEYFDRIRDDAQVERYIITNEAKKKTKRQRLGRYVKAVPESAGLFDYNISQFIYNDTVAFVDFRAKVASLIESSAFAEFQKKIFKLLFDKL